MLNTNAEAVRLVICPRCGARPPSPCVTATGNPASRPHGARTVPLEQGWHGGFGKARDAARRLIAINLERGKTPAAILDLLTRYL